MNRISRRNCLLGLALVLGVLILAPGARAQDQQLDAPTRITIKSDVLGEDRVVLVRTPAAYARNQTRYPVLYMTDGEAQIAHTIATLAFLAREGRIPEMIVVGITNTDRTRDLTPTSGTMPGGRPGQFPTSGGADKFLKFIETELIPNIESKYRVQPFRVFAGHSLGGMFAIHAMISRPDIFSAYIAVSPSLQWDNDIMLERIEAFLKSRKEFKKTLYVSLGTEPVDITDSYNMFRGLLEKYPIKDFEWEAQVMSNEDHGSVVLLSHYNGLRKAWSGWVLPRDPTTGAIAGGLPAAEEHYKRISQKAGYTIVPPEAMVNGLGYQLMGAGKMEEAIAAFKSNVERYPGSANVYDSLAEAYENSGRLDLAKPNYEKAYEIGRQTNDQNVAVYKTNFERVDAKLKENTAAKTAPK